MPRETRRLIRQQEERLAKMERQQADNRDLKKRGPKSGTLGESFEKMYDRTAKQVDQERARLRELHDLDRSFGG